MGLFEGIAPPLVTPFDEDGEIDEEAYGKLIDWTIESGVKAVVPCGSNGEVVYLDAEERERVIEIAVAAADGRVPVIAGTGSPSTVATIELTKEAERIGADGALVVTPFYYPLSQEEIVSHYRTLTAEVDLPILLYQVPKFTHQNFEPETVGELAEIPSVVGMKDSSGDFGFFQRTLKATEEQEFSLLSGSGDLIAAALRAGATGGILALANIAPAECARIYDLYLQGDERKARDLNYDLLELNRTITTRFGIAGLKAALSMRGMPVGDPRPPLQPLTAEEKGIVEDVLDRFLS